MRMNDIINNPIEFDSLAPPEPSIISKVYTAFVHVTGSTLVRSASRPVGFTITLDRQYVMDHIIDVEVVDCGVRVDINQLEWVINFEACGIMSIAMDKVGTARFAMMLVRAALPVFEFDGQQYEVPDSVIKCKSMHVADFDQRISMPIYRPDGH